MSLTRDLEKVYNASQSSLGLDGGQIISDTSETTPDAGYVFTAIQVITDASITAVGNVTGLSTLSVTANNIIYGTFTSITLASGSVIAYQREVI